MRKIVCYQTSDGALHEDADSAWRHVSDQYSTKLMFLAQEVAAIKDYPAAWRFIEQTLDTFVELKALAADMVLESPEEKDSDDE